MFLDSSVAAFLLILLLATVVLLLSFGHCPVHILIHLSVPFYPENFHVYNIVLNSPLVNENKICLLESLSLCNDVRKIIKIKKPKGVYGLEPPCISEGCLS